MINRKFWIGFVSLAMLFMVACGGLGVVYNDDRWYLMLAATMVVFIPAIYQVIRQEQELFTPVNLIFISVFFGTWVQLSIYLFQDDLKVPIPLNYRTDFGMIVTGLVASFMGIVSLLIGYTVGSESGSKKVASSVSVLNFNPVRAQIFGLVVFIFASILLVVYMNAVGFSDDITRFSVKRTIEEGGTLESFARYGFRFAQGGCIVLYFGVLLNKKQNKRNPKLLIIVTLLLFVVGCLGPFLMSSRSALLYFIITLFALNHFVSGRWGIRQLKLAILVCAIIILGMGALRYTQQRSVSMGSFNEDVGLSGLVRSIGLSNNFLGISKTSLLIDSVPSKESYRYGQTYFLWSIAPIPRAFWPDKPVVRIGGELGPSVFGTSDASGMPPGFIGESFLNFSWLGPVLVGGIMGLLLGKATRFCIVGALAGSVGLLAYSTILPLSFSLVSSDFTGTVVRFFQITLPVWLIYKLLVTKGPSYVSNGRVG